MAISLIQTVTKGTASSASSIAITWTGNTTTGNLIVVAVDIGTATIDRVTGITDSQSNAYNKIFSVAAGALIECELWYAYNITGGTTPTVTISLASSLSYNAIIREYSGLTSLTDPKDVAASGAISSSSSWTTATTAATNQADELVVAIAAAVNGHLSGAGAGFANYSSESTFVRNLGMEDKIISATGTQTATFTVSTTDNGAGGLATFKADTGAAPASSVSFLKPPTVMVTR